MIEKASALEMLKVQKGEYGLGFGIEGEGAALRFGHGGSLRNHVSQAVRAIAGSRAASRMEAAIRKAVEPNLPPAPKPIPKPKPQVRMRLSELRTLGKYNIMWMKKVVVEWDMKAIPWQVWVGIMFLYATIVLLRSRSKNSKPISLVSVD